MPSPNGPRPAPMGTEPRPGGGRRALTTASRDGGATGGDRAAAAAVENFQSRALCARNRPPPRAAPL